MGFVKDFLGLYTVVLFLIFGVFLLIFLLVGLGGGEIIASGMKGETLDSLFESFFDEGCGGCLQQLLAIAIGAFIVTAILFLCGLTLR